MTASKKIQHDLVIKFGSRYGVEEERAVLEVLRQGAPTSGDACLEFERDFADYCGIRHARVVSNGTAALFLSMVGLGIQPGDRVITRPMTWIATPAAPATLGADIDFVDIDPVTYNLDVNQLEDAITSTGDRAHLILPASHPHLPWTAMVGLALSTNVWYFCTNQYINQRCLAARDERHAKMGIVSCGFLGIFLARGNAQAAVDRIVARFVEDRGFTPYVFEGSSAGADRFGIHVLEP